MEQKCFFAGCKKRVSSVCHCQNQDTYCCSLHQAKHTRQIGQHLIDNLKVNLTREESKELSVKAMQGLKYLKSLKRSIRNSTLEFIDQVNSASRKALKMVKDVESGIKHFYSIVSLGKSINNEQYQWIKDVEFPDKPKEFKPCKHFPELFGVDLVTFGSGDWRECNEIVFSWDRNNGGLWSIDFETLKKVPLDYAPKIGGHSIVCKLDKENYFFFGGQRGGVVNETVIVNTKKKTFETLKSNSAKYFTGSALKDNKVHVFGGHNTSVVFNSCEVFDLKTKVWSPITGMPANAHCTTAALWNNTIILSGNELSCLYSYDGSSFLSVLSLQANTHKVVFDGWVLTAATLFEASENNVTKWTGISLNPQWAATYLFAFTVFRRGKYFYFIESSNNLMRLDTIEKKLEKIIYS